MNPLTADEQDARDMAWLAGGHGAALNDLMARHAEKLFHYLVRCLQNEDDAADLAQEAFVRVYQNRAKFDSGQKFSTWLYAIASNLVKDRYRWRSRHPQVSLEAENEQTEGSLADNLPAFDPAPDAQAETEERAGLVRKAVAALPDELRQPLILAVYQEMSQAEIAVLFKCSVKAVETRIYRARQQLRVSLAELLQAKEQ
ncbi:MAG TPA: sigma-70 family RNA polymerase sigma factor [Candidatus Binatia bacterium]|jgi:RNA polymerase sigma-70 factor (ECF subfamily)|nr:sigma-70 family RNA polymerase sigma factor [Candidatus Binatia bacterium]